MMLGSEKGLKRKEKKESDFKIAASGRSFSCI